MNRSDLTDKFVGFNFLFYLELSTEADTGSCKLILHLGASETIRGRAVLAEFTEVRNLCIQNIGGGLTQLEFLLIENISDRQMDRVNYSVKEMERDAMSFLCQGIDVRALD
jgi:hypothetical protein